MRWRRVAAGIRQEYLAAFVAPPMERFRLANPPKNRYNSCSSRP
jgi:hypothetical protein